MCKKMGAGSVWREITVSRTYLLPPSNTMGYSQMFWWENAEEFLVSGKDKVLLVQGRWWDGL